jgi:two-component system LytT family response regulator
MIHAIAIDDEPIALEIITRYAKEIPFLKLEMTFTDAYKALNYLRDHVPDLIFLDVKMPDISGLEFLKRVKTNPMVIFTTAYAEHAVVGFELAAIDYLLKPFSFERFSNACDRVRLLCEAGDHHRTKSIVVKDGTHLIRLNYDEICYLESEGNYVRFCLRDDTSVLIRGTLGGFGAELKDTRFIQVHRSFVINRDHVDRKENQCVMLKGKSIPLSRRFMNRELF